MERATGDAPKSGSTIREYFKQLERRIRVGLMAVFFIPLLALSVYFHVQFDISLKETGKLNLAAIAESQRNTVDLFLQERLTNIFSLFHSTTFDLTPSERQMQSFLQHLLQASDAFIDVGFLNSDGVQIGYAGPFPYLQDKNYSTQDWFLQLMQPGRMHTMTDIYFGFRNKLHFTIAVKQLIDGKPYVLRSTLDPEKFYMFLRTINHGRGVESFIVNAAGRFQLADPARWQALGASPFEPSPASRSGVQETTMNGNAALVAFAWMKEASWALVVSEPLQMAYATFYRARRHMLIGTAVITVAFISVVVWATRNLIGKARDNAIKYDEMHRQLLHASKMASLGELATGVAHEINNPLAIIMATSGVIKDRIDPQFDIDGSPEAIVQELKTIDMAVLRAKRITQQLLNFGRKTDPQLVQTDINSILTEVLDGVKGREIVLSNITLERDLEADLPKLLADQNQIRQVVVNLLNNACDAIEGPGRIAVESRLMNGDIHVTISDTGHGMDTAQMAKIFDPFYTTKEVGKGTGLGLSVSLSIIESMGGTLSVQSLPGAGSAFTIVLPVSKQIGASDGG
jgi:two-component system NtrC family sensor kinase